jgi:hypothetical protein
MTEVNRELLESTHRPADQIAMHYAAQCFRSGVILFGCSTVRYDNRMTDHVLTRHTEILHYKSVDFRDGNSAIIRSQRFWTNER